MRFESGTSGVVTVKAAEDLMPNVMDGELFEITSTIDLMDGGLVKVKRSWWPRRSGW